MKIIFDSNKENLFNILKEDKINKILIYVPWTKNFLFKRATYSNVRIINYNDDSMIKKINHDEYDKIYYYDWFKQSYLKFKNIPKKKAIIYSKLYTTWKDRKMSIKEIKYIRKYYPEELI